MQRANSLEKTLMLGKKAGGEVATEGEMLDGLTNSMDVNLSKLWKIVEDRGAWHAVIHRVAESQTI